MNIPPFFHICLYSREIIDLLPDLTKTLCWLFGGHCLREVFQSLYAYNLARALASHTSLITLNLFPCHKYVRFMTWILCHLSVFLLMHAFTCDKDTFSFVLNETNEKRTSTWNSVEVWKKKQLCVIEALKRCGLWRKYLTTCKQGLSQGEMQEIMTGWDPIVLILRGS